MEWIDIKTNPPPIYKEVIVCSDEGIVKSAIYVGNNKWNTFLNVVFWQHFPEAPEDLNKDDATTTVKKRGRKKKT